MRTSIALGSLLLLPCAAALGQDIGDSVEGLAVASEFCAQCHAVLPGEGVSPNPDPLPFEVHEALPFEDIAKTPGVTAMALFAWMTSSHPTMPDILLEKEDLRNVVAYILSLEDL